MRSRFLKVEYAHRWLIPIAALLATLPILLKGPSCGHDFDFHLLSWFEAATQFAHLHYPRWALSAAFNAGEPRFVFYPPLSWCLGAALGLVLPWTLVPAAFTFTALTLSGFSAHRLASASATANIATLASVLYLVNPYMLFTAYERTAYGELLAAAWIPLLAAAALSRKVSTVAIALPIGLLWLTNVPAAVMSCYALALLMSVRLLMPRNSLKVDGAANESRAGLSLKAIAGVALGLALSAIYLVPAVSERTLVQAQMATIEGMRISDNTLFHHMTPTPDNVAHDAVLHTASDISVELIVGCAFFCCVLIVRLRRNILQSPTLPMLVLTAAIAWMLSPLSLSVWRHSPELEYLQFPWRFCAWLSTALVLLGCQALKDLSWKTATLTLTALCLVALLVIPSWLVFRQECDEEDSLPARYRLFQSGGGSEPTDEYTPTDADNDSLHRDNPPFWLIPQDDPIDTPASTGKPPGEAPEHLALTLREPENLVLNRRTYPGWTVCVNRHPVEAQSLQREDGLIALSLPAGADTVDLIYRHTRDEDFGLALTVLAAVLTAALHDRRRFR